MNIVIFRNHAGYWCWHDGPMTVQSESRRVLLEIITDMMLPRPLPVAGSLA